MEVKSPEDIKEWIEATIDDALQRMQEELWDKISAPMYAILHGIINIGKFFGCIFEQIFEVSLMNFLNKFLQPELCSWFIYSFTTPCLFYWVVYVAAFLLYWLFKLPLDALQMSFIVDLMYNLFQFFDEVDFTNGMFYLTKFNEDVTCKCFTTPNYKYFFCWELSKCSLDFPLSVKLSDICIPDSQSELPHWETDGSGNYTTLTYDCEIPGCF